MKNRISLLAVLALFACGSAEASDYPMSGNQAVPPTDAATAEVEPAAQEFEMPFDLPMAPDTRIVDGHEYEGPVGMESYGSLATTGTAQDAVDFYEQTLIDAGFQSYSRSYEEGKIFIAFKRESDRFQISNSSGYVDVEEGETELRISASWPK